MGAPSPKKRKRKDRGRGGPTAPGLLTQPKEPDILSPEEVGRALLQIEDPLDVELIASADLAAYLTNPTSPVDHELIENLVLVMSRPRGPETRALLIAAAAVAEPPLAEALRSEAEQAAVANSPSPSWAGSVGTATITEAWKVTEAFGDQDEILMSFRYPGRDPALMAVLIDRTIGDLIKDAFVSREVEPTLERWRKEPDFTVEPIPVPEAAGIVLRALRNTDMSLDPPVAEDFSLTRAFLASLVRRVPGPVMPTETEPLSEDELERLVEEFAASEEARGLDDGFESIVRHLLEYQANWNADDPLRWSPMVVEMCMLDWLPRKALMDESEIVFVPSTLGALVRYSGRRRGLSEQLIRETTDTIDRFGVDYLDAMRDRSKAGPAKNLLLTMGAEGVDVLDKSRSMPGSRDSTHVRSRSATASSAAKLRTKLDYAVGSL